MLKESRIGKSISDITGKLFACLPLHPNILTLLSVVFAALAFFIFNYNTAISFILFLLALFLDMVDGAVARAKNLSSAKGAFLDGVADRIVEFFLLLCFFSVNLPLLFFETKWWLLIILFFGTCMTAFAKAYGEHAGVMEKEKAKRMGGIFERGERAFLLLVAFLLLALNSPYTIYLLAVVAIFSVITFLQRIFFVLGEKD